MSSDYSNPEGIDYAWRKAKEFLRPPPNHTPSTWAESNIRIPIGNAIPGLIKFDNAPYQREPLDMFANRQVERITLMWGAQTGKTQILNCALAYFIAHEPSSQIMMQPSQGDLHTWLETKFNSMVDANDVLSERIAKPRSRDGVNNQTMKSYPGGFLMFAWAGSPRTMRGRSAPKIFCDEVDGYEYNAEGHPVSLLWQRAATYADQRKLLVTSTPTIKGSSFVESSFEDGDQRHYYIPCPHCEKEIRLLWAQVTWDKDEEGNHLPETAFYACQECGSPITDPEKRVALRSGRWVASKPFRGHVSYHLNELYSSFRRWRDIVRSFLEKKATNDLQSFVNVSLAETWASDDGESVDADELAERREFIEKIPADVALLVGGIDVQDDRLELSILGFKRGEAITVISHHIFRGDMSRSKPWDDLSTVLFDTYHTEDGREMIVQASCLDTGGHFTEQAYRYARLNAGKRVFAIKGMSGSKPIAGRPSKSNMGKVNLFPIGVDTAKQLIFSRLSINEPGDGYVTFSDTLDDEYFKQLTSEVFVTRYEKGQQKRFFKQIRKRNEALDCFVYAYAAYAILGININSLSDKLQANSEVADEPKPSKKAKKYVPNVGSNYMNSWR